jgi:hypothetical protein
MENEPAAVVQPLITSSVVFNRLILYQSLEIRSVVIAT